MLPDDTPRKIFLAPPIAGGMMGMAKPGDLSMLEFLDYIEDMSLLIGCSNCRSFNVRESELAGCRVQHCFDCGEWVEIPLVN